MEEKAERQSSLIKEGMCPMGSPMDKELSTA
jgi:hypothetical protein